MEPHQQRVIEEQKDLNEKLIKLQSFIPGSIFAKLDDAEKDRLRQQAQAMGTYNDILSARIKAF